MRSGRPSWKAADRLAIRRRENQRDARVVVQYSNHPTPKPQAARRTGVVLNFLLLRCLLLLLPPCTPNTSARSLRNPQCPSPLPFRVLPSPVPPGPRTFLSLSVSVADKQAPPSVLALRRGALERCASLGPRAARQDEGWGLIRPQKPRDRKRQPQAPARSATPCGAAPLGLVHLPLGQRKPRQRPL